MSSTDPVVKAENSFIKAEPVLAGHAGAAVLGYVGTLLVTHGVVTHSQASALTQQVLPAVVSLLLVGLGFLVRRFVTPTAKVAERVEAEVSKRLTTVPLLPEGAAPPAGFVTVPEPAPAAPAA